MKGKKFGELWFETTLFEKSLVTVAEDREEPDYTALQGAYVEMVKEVLGSGEVSGDVLVEWLINLDVAYERIIETYGSLLGFEE